MWLILTLPTRHIKYTFEPSPVNNHRIVARAEWLHTPSEARLEPVPRSGVGSRQDPQSEALPCLTPLSVLPFSHF